MNFFGETNIELYANSCEIQNSTGSIRGMSYQDRVLSYIIITNGKELVKHGHQVQIRKNTVRPSTSGVNLLHK